MVQKGFPGDDLLLVFQQIVQQVEFPPGELYGSAPHRYLVALGVHDQGAAGELGGLRRGGGPLAQSRPDAGQQFFDGEGLGDIVVRPGVQAGHLVHHCVTGGEHDNRRLTFPPQTAEHLHAGHAWEHDV